MNRQSADEPAETTASRGRLLITGASGYIGRRLASTASAAGFEVVAAVRQPERLPGLPGVERRRFDLRARDPLDDLVAGVDAVVHLAAEIAARARPAGDEGPNVGGTRRLLEASRRQGVRRFLFLSSQSAAPEAATDYGRDKWAVEQLLTGENEIVVRPGMVTGGPARGVYGQLLRLCRRSTWLPMVRPRAPVHPVHLDDLCRALLELVERHGTLPRSLKVAPAGPIHFGDYLRTIARLRLGYRLRLLPVPSWPVVAVCRLSGRLPLLARLPCERLLGLITLGPMPPEPSALDLGLEMPIRTVREALLREGLERRLLREGRALLQYVFGHPPQIGPLRRYARAIARDPGARPLDLPAPVIRWPRLLRLLEPPRRPGAGRLQDRLSLALRVGEMTPAAAPRLHSYRRRSPWLAVPAVAWNVGTEALLLPVRALLGRLAQPRPEESPRPDRRGP